MIGIHIPMPYALNIPSRVGARARHASLPAHTPRTRPGHTLDTTHAAPAHTLDTHGHRLDTQTGNEHTGHGHAGWDAEPSLRPPPEMRGDQQRGFSALAARKRPFGAGKLEVDGRAATREAELVKGHRRAAQPLLVKGRG